MRRLNNNRANLSEASSSTNHQHIGLKRSEAIAELRFKPLLTEAQAAGYLLWSFNNWYDLFKGLQEEGVVYSGKLRGYIFGYGYLYIFSFSDHRNLFNF